MATPRRIMCRLGPDDDAWLVEQAADEGVATSIMLAMIVNRLRQGRPPLLRMIMPQKLGVVHRVVMSPEAIEDRNMLHRAWEMEPEPEPVPQEAVDALLEQRLAELPESLPQSNGQTEPVAVSLRRVPRESYNPGRQ